MWSSKNACSLCFRKQKASVNSAFSEYEIVIHRGVEGKIVFLSVEEEIERE